MAEEAQNISIKKAWITTLLTPQVIVIIGTSFVGLVLFIDKVKRATKDVDNLNTKVETKISRDEFNALKDQVTRQYTTQREMNEKFLKEVEQIQTWIEYQKGYQQALKDQKPKP